MSARITSTLAALGLALSGMAGAIVTAPSATASESYAPACNAKWSFYTGVSSCSSGTGQHRVVTTCHVGPVLYTYYGPWVSQSQQSKAACKLWQGRTSVGVQTR